jgi:hypothetical protein
MDSILRESAITNALSFMNEKARLPDGVFTRPWDVFFESYYLFDDAFVEAKNKILAEEGSSYIALVNMGNVRVDSDVSSLHSITLDRKTTAHEYLSKLKGDGSPTNWIFLMDRYACASDAGNWCIYCEKENDIAVLAARHDFSKSLLPTLQTLLKVKPAKDLFGSKASGSTFFDSLVPAWKAKLLANYGS